MELKEGMALYVRLDFKIGEEMETEQDGMDTFNYLQSVAKERYLVAGILGDMEAGVFEGAMVLFEAKDMEEAKAIADADPIISRGFYRYELYKWNIMMA